MKGAVLVAPRKLEVKDVATPEISDNEVLVEVKANSICGTDIEIYNGKVPIKYPRIMGHEIAGIVKDVGKNVSKNLIGARVVVEPNLYCGKCALCREGLTQLCPNGRRIGIEIDGGLAEYVKVPADHVYPIKGNITFEEATLIQPLATVIHATRRVGTVFGKSVLIVGLGNIGLMFVQVLKSMGAYPIIGTTRSQWKLDLAKKLGADYTISTDDPKIHEIIKELTDGLGIDIVVETSGSKEALEKAVRFVKPGGKILKFSIDGGSLTLPAYDIYFKEISIIGSRASQPRDWPIAISFVERGLLNTKAFITDILPLDSVEEGIKIFEEGKSLKVVIKP